MSNPSERIERARARRSQWSGEVVERGAAGPSLYAGLDPAERLAALVALNDHVWRTVGLLPATPLARRDWPGEVFDLMART